MKAKIPWGRIRYVPDADFDTIQTIRHGILFLMAFWSAPAIGTFVELTEVLARLDSEDLELVVADLDGSPELYEVAEFRGKVHGYGEMAWIHEGKILMTYERGLSADCFETNTITLMSAG